MDYYGLLDNERLEMSIQTVDYLTLWMQCAAAAVKKERLVSLKL